MTILVYALIYAGSALMVFNIVYCYRLVRGMLELDIWDHPRRPLYVPLGLLVAFLIGYLAVAVFGDPDMVVAGILSGGSLYVTLMLFVMAGVFERLKDNNARVTARYGELQDSFKNLAKNYQSVFRVNLTKDVIEARLGTGLYETDMAAESYTGLLASRGEFLASEPVLVEGDGLFTRDGLLEAFGMGRSSTEEVLYCKVPCGRSFFVRMRATLAQKPGSGDVMAFITEGMCNDELVDDTLLEKALIGQYDMIAYLLDGRYSVVIGDEDRIQGSIFPTSPKGAYATYLEERVAPVICGDDAHRAQLQDSLSLSSVERALSENEPYEVNIACDIDGETFHKRFVFYVIDWEARFFLLLKSDTTQARREEAERSRILSAALEEAQRASEAKTTFLSNMSHDIRTPMNAIVGYTEIAGKCDDLDQTRAYLGKIEASNKYMLALIDDVLEMSRIESGKLDLVEEEVDLVEVMGNARDMFSTQMAEKGLDFAVDAAGVRDRVVLCDKSRFNRVLLNLLSNAYKFTPQGGSVRATMRQTADARDGRARFELRVADTGVGMSPEFAEKVFEAFERERTTTASGIQGTGLGMAITKRIVEAMGGCIGLSTRKGEGTTFTVELEFGVVRGTDAPEPADRAGDEGADVPADADLTGKRALLVEDNEINREIATMFLEDIGLSVDEACDGKQALDMLVAAGPGVYDIVVTDIQMPVMDGYEEARAIRALGDPALSRVPIVAMSANAFAEDRQASREAGMDDHIAKPVDMDVLRSVFARILS